MCPPSLAWYSSDSIQQTFSGSQRGTVTASRPPGLSTRISSSIARSSCGHVFEDLRGDHEVEGAVVVRQVQRVALDGLGLGRRRRLALVLHGLQDRVDVVEVLGTLVERDDVRAAPERLERVPARAAAHVDHRRCPRRRRAGRSRRSACLGTRFMARSYTETVCAATDSQLKTSTARRRPAAPSRRSSSGESSSSPSTLVRSSTSPGATSRAHSPSVPTTSGSAPARLATIGVPLAMASTAGSEKPS